MNKFRKIKKVLKSKPTSDGAGVRLKRVFGFHDLPRLDPFLLLDDFGSDNPEDFIAGFPWHPHRGIETVTYILKGKVEHQDSIGNKGIIQSGDIQWMIAGSGIVHQEMPKNSNGGMRGFQLWVNLPAKHKMMKPRYHDINSEQIPEVAPQQNVKIKVISGEFNDIKGPVQDIVVDTEYLDITLEPNTVFIKDLKSDYKVFAYVVDGSGYFDENKEHLLTQDNLAIFENGEHVKIQTDSDHLRLLLISGKPLNEPVAWGGPIVMNTKEELDTAFKEYENGTFIK